MVHGQFIPTSPQIELQRALRNRDRALALPPFGHQRVAGIEAIGIHRKLMSLVGVDVVAFSGEVYEPDPGGVPAFIVGAVAGDDLDDLVAIELGGPRVATRMGWATTLSQTLALARRAPWR